MSRTKLARTIIIVAMIAAGCTQDGQSAGDPKRPQPSGTTDVPSPTPAIASTYRTTSAQGDHGLRVELLVPWEVAGGQAFEIVVKARDKSGEINGLQLSFGDGNDWGGLPTDLVCSGVVGETPAEPPSKRTKRLDYAYRDSGIYVILATVASGGCFADGELATVRGEVKVAKDSDASNGPSPPRAKVGHAYYVDGDPSVLVSDIGGYDQDGFVALVKIDWGDGSEQTVLERPLSECRPVGHWPGGWFVEPTKHRYERQGEYEVKVTATSVGCDGEQAQTDTTVRSLEYPPLQGS